MSMKGIESVRGIIQPGVWGRDQGADLQIRGEDLELTSSNGAKSILLTGNEIASGAWREVVKDRLNNALGLPKPENGAI